MATSKGQRMGILIIAGIMLFGTIGGFLAMMVTPGNEAKDREALEIAFKEYNNSLAELNAKNYPEFSKYAKRVAKFDASKVKKLETKDLKVGDGAEIDENTKFSAYYILWLPNGKIQEQSIDDGKLKDPMSISEGLKETALIDGWKEGMVGMKIGGVRELIIPADKAYGKDGKEGETKEDSIPANTPLKFIVMAVESPEVPELLRKEYAKYGLSL